MASATLTLGPNAQLVLATIVATNTIAVGTNATNVTFTAETSGATGNQFNVGSAGATQFANDVITATNLAAAINASVTAGVVGVLKASQLSVGGVLQPVVLLVSTNVNVTWTSGSTSSTFTFSWTVVGTAPVVATIALTGGAGETTTQVAPTFFGLSGWSPQIPSSAFGVANPASGTNYITIQLVNAFGGGNPVPPFQTTAVSFALTMSNTTVLTTGSANLTTYPVALVGGAAPNDAT